MDFSSSSRWKDVDAYGIVASSDRWTLYQSNASYWVTADGYGSPGIWIASSVGWYNG